MNIKNYLTMMLAATALTACNTDDTLHNETPDENKSAWIGFSISLPQAAMPRSADTKAVDDYADKIENTIQDITLYTEEVGIGSKIYEIGSFTLADFTVNAATNSYVAQKAIRVLGKAGEQKDIYVIINNPASNKITADQLSVNLPASKAYVTTAKELTTANAFTMLTAVPASVTLYADEATAKLPANHATVEVARAASKVLVSTSLKTSLNTTTTIPDKGITGNFLTSSLKWTIGNSNRKLFPTINTGKQDPNWSKLTTETWANLAAEYELLPAQTPAPTTPTYSMPVASNEDATNYPTGYKGANGSDPIVQFCLENSNEEHQTGNTTYISVCAAFIPSLIVTVDAMLGITSVNAVITAIVNPAVATGIATQFYYHKDKLLYFTQEAYNAFLLLPTATAQDFFGPYTDGKCYYNVPIGKKAVDVTHADLGVVRNAFYTISIASMTAPGNPAPIAPQPIDPVLETSSHISVKIKVNNWIQKTMGQVVLE